jgi:hypothetical protein
MFTIVDYSDYQESGSGNPLKDGQLGCPDGFESKQVTRYLVNTKKGGGASFFVCLQKP